MGTIYLITNNQTGEKYVGQTIQEANNRWKAHLKKCAESQEITGG